MLAAVGAVAAAALLGSRRPAQEAPVERAFAIPGGPGRIEVEVLNGSGRQGLARAATRALRQRGLDVVYFGNSDSTLDSTIILVRRGDGRRADEVREALGIGRVRTAIDTLRRVDMSVILGRDYGGPAEFRP